MENHEEDKLQSMVFKKVTDAANSWPLELSAEEMNSKHNIILKKTEVS
jgi:hypothetical protein